VVDFISDIANAVNNFKLEDAIGTFFCKSIDTITPEKDKIDNF